MILGNIRTFLDILKFNHALSIHQEGHPTTFTTDSSVLIEPLRRVHSFTLHSDAY